MIFYTQTARKKGMKVVSKGREKIYTVTKRLKQLKQQTVSVLHLLIWPPKLLCMTATERHA
jgi:hypothetical protein